MAAIDPRQMMTCPYNKAHQIEHSRLQFHLEKCRKQYTGSKKVTCPFDSKHVINEEERDYHVTVCPKRGEAFDREAYVVDDTEEFVSRAEPPTVVTSAYEENWDCDNYESYVPDPAKQNAHVIKKIKGATPSQRRAARMEGVRNFVPPPGQGASSPRQS